MYKNSSFKVNLGFSSAILLTSIVGNWDARAMNLDDEDSKGSSHHPAPISSGVAHQEDTGEAEYQCGLGCMAQWNDSKTALRIDFPKAFEHFKIAAAKGHGKAAYHVADMYKEGYGAKENSGEDEYYPEYVKWLTRAADLKYSFAQNDLGTVFVKEGKDEEAFNLFTQSAAQKNPAAIFNLGFMHECGRYVSKNASIALGFYEEASALGHKNSHKAIEVMKKHNLPAIYNRGVMYATGEGVNKNFFKALEYFNETLKLTTNELLRKLAEQCIIETQYSIGLEYAEHEDHSNAKEWLKSPADKNYGPALHDLGVICTAGEEYAKAKYYFTRAVKFGDAEIQERAKEYLNKFH